MSNLKNLISIELTDAEVKTITDNYVTIANVLKNKLVSLNADERQEYGRVGVKTEPYVREGQNIMNERPDFIPNEIMIVENQKDWKAFNQLKALSSLSETIHFNISDSLILLGNDLFEDVNTLKNYLEYIASNNVEDARALLERLQTKNPRAQRRSRKSAPPKN